VEVASGAETVGGIKAKLQEASGTPVALQRLIFGGRMLQVRPVGAWCL
jgi:hypothetical protein